MSSVDDLPAFDRVQSPAPDGVPDGSPGDARPGGGRLALRVALAVTVLAAVAWAGLRLWPSSDDAGDVLVQLAAAAAEFQPDVVTTVPDEAHDYVLQQSGWSVAPPDLPGLTLVGVGLPSVGEVRAAATASAIEMPAFRYEGAAGERAVVFAYDYILLDRIGSAYDLPEGTYALLSEPTPVDSRVVDGAFVVTWRRRAMVFSAVTTSEETADRVRRAVGV